MADDVRRGLEKVAAQPVAAVDVGDGAGRPSRWRGNSADVIAQVVRLLGAIVRRVDTPLLIVVLLPLLPAVVLLVATLWRGGSDVPFVIILTFVLLIPSVWLAVRRAQLRAALQPPDAAAAEIAATLSPTDLWADVRDNLVRLKDSGKTGITGLGRRIWQGVRLGGRVTDRFAEMPRLAPFLPGRLRGLGLLTVACLIASGVLTVLAFVKVITALVGIG